MKCCAAKILGEFKVCQKIANFVATNQNRNLPPMYPKITVSKHKLASIHRFHPWIFSGAIAATEGKPLNGSVVSVCDPQNRVLATGHYSTQGSIAVRVLAFAEVEINTDFWVKKIENALKLRQNYVVNEQTNCFRLIHGEGDGLSGLVVDIYHKTAIIQAHSAGMHHAQADISAALQLVMGDGLDTIYYKTLGSLPAELAENKFLLGDAEHCIVLENGLKFEVNWVSGQKTGFFIDQRNNRQLLASYSKNKRVLNTFCYTGGFSVYALQAGAELVCSVDSSQSATKLTTQNVALNGDFENHTSVCADVFDFLNQNKDEYDTIVLDPPAFAKNLKARHNAVQAYKRLNALAMRQICAGGVLFTFSCSQVVDTELFYHTICAAALEAGRGIRVLHRISQPVDHPVNIFHAEGSYLKGLVLLVE